MFNNIKMAVLGCGYWGKNLVRNFYQLGVLKYVFDENKDIMERICAQYPDVTAVTSLEDILADTGIQAVACAAPASTHYQIAKACLAASKHVFMEKPLTMTVEQGREICGIAEDNKLILMVDHILQSHPAYIKLKSLVKQDKLGKVRHIYSRRLSFGKIRSEENALWSLAPHDISMVLGLLDEMPQHVMGWGGSWVKQKVADMVEAQLDFSSGTKAKISVSWLNPFKEQRLMVCGDKAMAVFDDTLDWMDKLKLYHHKIEHNSAIAGEVESIALEEGEPLKNQCQSFLAAVAGGAKPVSDGKEGLRVLTVLEALSESLKLNGEGVKLNCNDDAKFFVHPTAIIDSDVTIGSGSKIWHFSHVLSGSVIGENCNLGQNVVVGPNVLIGRGVKIQNNVSVYEGVTLEDDVFCGPSMVFTNVHNPRANIIRKNEYRGTILRQGATVGANATIICGHSLGRWCMVGAGAVVTRDVPDYALVVGNPARRIGWVCRCGVRLGSGHECKACGRAYMEKNNVLEMISGDRQ